MKTVAVILLVFTVLLLTVFGAGVFAWTICSAAVVVSGAWTLCAWRRTPAGAANRTRQALSLELVYAAIMAYLALTLLPLPVWLSAIPGTRRFEQNRIVVKALDDASDLRLPGRTLKWFALTRNRAGTMRMAVLAISAFGATMLASVLPDKWRRGYVRYLVYIGTLVAVGGHIGKWHIPQGFKLWWMFPVPQWLPGPVACFVNPNHFAGFLAILCPPALALAADDFSNRRRVSGILSAACFATMSVVLALSLSRGAMLAYAAALVTTVLLLLISRRFVAALIFALLVISGAAYVFAVPNHPVKERILTLQNPIATESGQTRLKAWRDSLLIWRTYPLVGCGANAFRATYPQHRRTSERATMTHPENEYIQLAAESGLIGVTLAVMLVIAAIRSRFPAGEPPHSHNALMPAAGGALAAAGVHALFDFAPHVPLYSIVLASLIGTALRPQIDVPSPFPRRAEMRSRPPWVALGSLFMAGFLSLFARNMQQLDSNLYLRLADTRELARALVWSPTSWYAWLCFGRQACLRGGLESERFGERCMSQATAYDPNNYLLWRELGHTRLRLKDYSGARAAFKRVRKLRHWVPVPEVPEEKE